MQVITHPNLINALGESANQELVSSHMIFAPASWDWRVKGAISPVQNQGLYADAQAVVATGLLVHCSLKYEPRSDITHTIRQPNYLENVQRQ